MLAVGAPDSEQGHAERVSLGAMRLGVPGAERFNTGLYQQK